MIAVGVVGVAGRMGSLIARGVIEADDLSLRGGLEMLGHPWIGKDMGVSLGLAEQGILVTSDREEAFVDSDVIIDFSLPQVTLATAAYAKNRKKALITGTTGFTEEELQRITEDASFVPIVLAPNMSIGVNVMFKVVEELAGLLGEVYDAEVVETHHRLKKDAPSGTAKGLALAIARGRGCDLSEKARYERHGFIGQRPSGEIGIQCLRAGDIVGDHTVLFAGNNERIEITHRAHTRQNFVQGALRAARWVMGRQPALYTMMDVLGLNA
ncbi:MAG TPA: 4-hydroxy-tetrahydrodipicolinate reductase [Deltaproteobacteria bacterium]|nr:4-hydroxy-tetrahydrodipicolinate reductase [Deltaproteobacteria bacterium]